VSRRAQIGPLARSAAAARVDSIFEALVASSRSTMTALATIGRAADGRRALRGPEPILPEE
jgi:hypothetical protein